MNSINLIFSKIKGFSCSDDGLVERAEIIPQLRALDDDSEFGNGTRLVVLMKFIRETLLPLVVGSFTGLIFTSLFSTTLSAQTVIAPTGNAICWDQVAQDLPTAQSLIYQSSTDNGPIVAITPTCSGTSSPFTCQIPLPAITPGAHSVSVTASTKLSDGSLLTSTAGIFTYIIGTPPSPPSNFRIIKIIATLLISLITLKWHSWI